MNTQSRKAKGRNLQKFICKTLLESFPAIPVSDIISRPMGSQGTDVVLSSLAKTHINYKIEAKNQEAMTNVYKAFEQAQAQKGDEQPLLVVKMNRKQPLAIVNFNHFIELIKQNARDN